MRERRILTYSERKKKMKMHCMLLALPSLVAMALVMTAVAGEPEKPAAVTKGVNSTPGTAPAADLEQSKTTQKGQQPAAPDGPIVIEEHIWVHFVDEPAHHMERARESFLKKDTMKAAAEIRKVEAYLRATAGNAKGKVKRGLIASAEELKRLARDVESGAATQRKDLDQAFARAHHALARHHYSETYKYWAKKDVENTGHHLKATAMYLEHAATATGRKVESGTKTVVADARAAGDKLIHGSGFVADKVGQCIEAVGAEVEKTGKHIESFDRD